MTTTKLRLGAGYLGKRTSPKLGNPPIFRRLANDEPGAE